VRSLLHRAAPLALAGMLALAGCAGQAETTQLQNDQFQLRGMIASQRQQMEALRQQTRRLQDEIDELKHGGGTGGGGGGDQLASIEERLNKLDASVSALQAGGAAAAAPSAMASTPETAPGATAAPPAAPAPGAPAWQADVDKELAGGDNTAPGWKIYRDGLQAMKEQKYPVAIARFTVLQKKYPKSPLTEPGEYFLANALFEAGKYDQSILQFNDLVMRYPKGRFTSAALLREAQAFVNLNDKIDARLTLQKLLTDHADSEQAPPAREMMKELEG
jgi:tol-pal system protein YbgF